MSLNNFYENVLTSIGLHVSEDGFIYIVEPSAKIKMLAGGKPLVLPTRDHLKSLLHTNNDGVLEISKIPYNPLNENVVKGDTTSLKKTKLVIERKLDQMIAVAGNLLLTLAKDAALQKNTTLELNKFLKSLSQAQNPGIKKLVDDASIDNWDSLYANSLKKDKGLVSIFLKKSGISKGIKHNRLATLSLPAYDELLVSDKDTPCYGVRLRRKDIVIFKLLYEYLLPDIDEDNTIVIGSNDGESPAFISLMSLYLKTVVKLNKTIQSLSGIDESTADAAKVNITVSLEELDNLSIYKNELNTVPNEIDIGRSEVTRRALPVPSADIYNRGGNQAHPVLNPDKPLSIIENQTVYDENPMNKILYGGGGQMPTATPIAVYPTPAQSFQPPMQSFQSPMQSFQSPMQSFQPPMQSYQSPMHGHQHARPMGINNIAPQHTVPPWETARQLPIQQGVYNQNYGQPQPVGINTGFNQGYRF